MIRQKVIGYDRPVEEMKIDVVQKSKYFSKDADIVLLCLTHEHGYGNWGAIKNAIRRDTRTRFDHLFMSRSEQELSKRVDILVKSLIAENQNVGGKKSKKAANTNGDIPADNPEDEGSDVEMLYEPGIGLQRSKDEDDDEKVEHDEDDLRVGQDCEGDFEESVFQI